MSIHSVLFSLTSTLMVNTLVDVKIIIDPYPMDRLNHFGVSGLGCQLSLVVQSSRIGQTDPGMFENS